MKTIIGLMYEANPGYKQGETTVGPCIEIGVCRGFSGNHLARAWCKRLMANEPTPEDLVATLSQAYQTAKRSRKSTDGEVVKGLGWLLECASDYLAKEAYEHPLDSSKNRKAKPCRLRGIVVSLEVRTAVSNQAAGATSPPG